jgi:hypothetical protein
MIWTGWTRCRLTATEHLKFWPGTRAQALSPMLRRCLECLGHAGHPLGMSHGSLRHDHFAKIQTIRFDSLLALSNVRVQAAMPRNV